MKQGHSSAIVQFDLGGMPDLLNVLSGTTDNVALLDQIETERGLTIPQTGYRCFMSASRRGNVIRQREPKRSDRVEATYGHGDLHSSSR